MSYILGIDPGTTTGLAFFDAETMELKNLLSEEHSKVEALIASFVEVSKGALTVFYEDSRKQPYFNRAGVSARAQLKMARNVGQVDQMCADIKLCCTRLKIVCVGISPKQKGRKFDHMYFYVNVSNDYSRTNQHQRDAAQVALAGVRIYGNIEYRGAKNVISK